MELYQKISYLSAELITKRYSTSFSLSSRLFSRSIRKYIYAIYGMVRIADEIVDTYEGGDVSEKLSLFEYEVYASLDETFNTNPILNAFGEACRVNQIDKSDIVPFFDSMRLDLTKNSYEKEEYDKYIYGSAEVIGLMCLKVFTKNNTKMYKKLENGARALASAYQKVNFLRDFSLDYKNLGRIYFPDVSYDSFDQNAKLQIENDIKKDFAEARKSIKLLPKEARKAVLASYYYYNALFDKIQEASAEDIKKSRLRISDYKKIFLLIKVFFEK